MALIVCTNIPSSCQYDQINSSKHGSVSLCLQDAETFFWQVSIFKTVSYEPDITEFVPDQSQIGERLALRAVHKLEVFAPQIPQINC